jgi:preprotein translocase subunit SecA
MEHIDDMTYLKEQVAFAGYAQKDPKIEYQDQGFQRFQQLLATIDTTIIRSLFKLDFTQFMTLENLQPKNDQAAMQTNESEINKELEETGAGYSGVARQNSTKQALQKTVKVGRNDTCPCGSGKKYKKCHGANT